MKMSGLALLSSSPDPDLPPPAPHPGADTLQLLADQGPDLVFRVRLRPPGCQYLSPSAVSLLGYTAGELCRNPGLVAGGLDGDSRFAFRRWAANPADSFEIRCTHRDGATVWLELRGVAVRDRAGRVAAVEGIARDVTGRRQAEDRLQGLAAVAETILATPDPRGALEMIAARARQLVGSAFAAIVVPDGPRSVAFVSAASGLEAADLEGTCLEGSAGPGSAKIGDPGRAAADISALLGATRPSAALRRIGPAMVVALSTAERCWGTLLVGNIAGGRLFTESDLRVVQAFADQAAIALAYGDARRELERLSLLDDRDRIARDLHDGVIQSIYGIGMVIDATVRSGDLSMIQSRLPGITGALNRVVGDLRRYIFDLTPDLLSERGLGPAVAALAQDFTERSGVRTSVSVDTLLQPHWEAGADLIQITREALSNVARHGGAATCSVQLRQLVGSVVLEIADDGRGFSPAGVTGGQGITNIRQRAAALGGSGEIRSSPGHGTRVVVTLPC